MIRISLLCMFFCLLCMAAIAQQPEEAVLARNDLAGRLGVAADRIEVAAVEQVTWPDTSLGCPQEGQVYAQVLVPGYRILLHVGGLEYEYHSDRKGRAVYCSRNILRNGGVPAVIERARADLAQRLGCDVVEVALVEAPFVDWPTDMLPRPEELNAVPLEQRPGYRPVFRCRNNDYEYRTGLVEEVSFVQELPQGTGESYRIAYLQLADRPDGNNLWDLVERNSITGVVRTLVPHVADFAVAPHTGQVIYVRRSPQGYMLHLRGQPSTAIAQGADLRGLSWSPDGARYSAWVREQAEGPWRLVVGAPGDRPVTFLLSAQDTAPGLPTQPQWQGDMLSYNFETEAVRQGFMIELPAGQVTRLPQGQFAGWLQEPGSFLLLDGERLLKGSKEDLNRQDVLARLPGLVWARVLPGDQQYVALTQEGNLVRAWYGPLGAPEAPKLVSELMGGLVQAQLSQRGTLLMVQTVGQQPDRRGQCDVTLVELPTAEAEPLSGVCVRAQLLPMQ